MHIILTREAERKKTIRVMPNRKPEEKCPVPTTNAAAAPVAGLSSQARVTHLKFEVYVQLSFNQEMSA